MYAAYTPLYATSSPHALVFVDVATTRRGTTSPLDREAFARALRAAVDVWLDADRKRSQAALARLIGVGPSALTHWLTGRQLPERDSLLALAKTLRISIDDLLFGAGRMTPATPAPQATSSLDLQHLASLISELRLQMGAVQQTLMKFGGSPEYHEELVIHDLPRALEGLKAVAIPRRSSRSSNGDNGTR